MAASKILVRTAQVADDIIANKGVIKTTSGVLNKVGSKFGKLFSGGLAYGGKILKSKPVVGGAIVATTAGLANVGWKQTQDLRSVFGFVSPSEQIDKQLDQQNQSLDLQNKELKYYKDYIKWAQDNQVSMSPSGLAAFASDPNGGAGGFSILDLGGSGSQEEKKETFTGGATKLILVAALAGAGLIVANNMTKKGGKK